MQHQFTEEKLSRPDDLLEILEARDVRGWEFVCIYPIELTDLGILPTDIPKKKIEYRAIFKRRCTT